MENKNIVVYCGSRTGNDCIFTKIAKEVGTLIARKNFTLIYGGGKAGLMGKVADSAMQENGTVIGVIPEVFVEKEQAHYKLTKLFKVKDLAERKQYFLNHGDIFIILPGGIGTLEEFADTASFIHTYKNSPEKFPVFILNINGFYNPLINLLKTYAKYGFTSEKEWKNIIFCNSVDELNKYI